MVRMVFRQYIAGESYSRIAAELERAGYPYSEGATRWNKNMVGRILQNSKYLGQDAYPMTVVSKFMARTILTTTIMNLLSFPLSYEDATPVISDLASSHLIWSPPASIGGLSF